MYIFIIFSAVILLAAIFTVKDKISSYQDDNKSVWADGDSVRIMRNDKDNPNRKDNFMIRIQ